jgi:hypothetical protein
MTTQEEKENLIAKSEQINPKIEETKQENQNTEEEKSVSTETPTTEPLPKPRPQSTMDPTMRDQRQMNVKFSKMLNYQIILEK